MIDTIVLMLQPDQFRITDHSKFSPSTIGFFQTPYYSLGGRGNLPCKQNPTKEEFKRGIYKPRLTVTRRPIKGGFQITLRIEFSIPKLLFGNNFDELEEKDFEPVIQKLCKILYDMSVIVFPKTLREAPVSAIHYSKNVPLLDYSTPASILTEISKINLTEKLDLNQTDFRNGGHCVRLHSNAHELALYDKMKDLDKAKVSEKRAVEKDSAVQLDLFEKLEPRKPFEVLRMEARLGKREVIRRLFEKLGIKADFVFAQVFKKEISRKVLLSYLDIIKKGYEPFTYKPKSAKNFVAEVQVMRPDLPPRKILQMLGFLVAGNEMGMRGLREALKRRGKHHWPRLLNDWRGCRFNSDLQALKPIEDALRDFTPLRLGNHCQRSKKTG